MKYVWAEVFNYKSFFDSRPIQLNPHLNVIIGRNNSGKTALLEGVSLRYADKPHRSIVSAPDPGYAIAAESETECVFSVSPAEVQRVLAAIPVGQHVTIPYPGVGPAENADALFQLLMTAGELSIRARYHASSLRSVSPFTEPYKAGNTANHPCALFRKQGNAGQFTFSGNYSSDGSRLEYVLANAFANRIYSFRAERLNIGTSGFGGNSELSPNAANLPEVLNTLQGRNKERYQRYNDLVSRVLPSVRWIGVRPGGAAGLEIVVWEIDPASEREDLAVPLAEGGTGIGQVLAMLYVIVTADTERVLIIDEPNSFLHPGAVRTLLEVFREHPQHQYIVSSHSPQTIASASGSPAVHLVRKAPDGTSIVTTVDPKQTAHAREVLAEVGARLSDVFGADAVLWVEGATEEASFRIIVESILGIPLGTTSIVGVLHTGDFDRRSARWALELYKRVSSGGGMIPPALGYVFDRELRSASDIEDIARQSRGQVTFLPRRMYENYLLNASAISAVLSGEGVQAEPEVVQKTLDAAMSDSKYFPKGTSLAGAMVDGAAVLRDVFHQLSSGTSEYSKVLHGTALTKWLVEHRPDGFSEVAAILRKKLDVSKRSQEDASIPVDDTSAAGH